MPNTEEDFWAKVDMTSDSQGCWLFSGCKNAYGYGRMRYKGKLYNTHVLAYILSGKNIPEGLQLAHSELCKGKRHCCNPDHLTPKTARENALDRHRDNSMTQAKLTAEQVLEIRDKYAKGGISHRKLAEEYKISQQNISRILTRKLWSHI